jgi:hypothetical protein
MFSRSGKHEYTIALLLWENIKSLPKSSSVKVIMGYS